MFQLLLLLLLSCINKIVVCYDCNIGCEYDTSVNTVVCGEDNNDYPNECFAICQGVTVSGLGSCNDGSSVVAESSTSTDSVTVLSSPAVITAGFISIDIMQQYQDEGYKFVRQWDYNKLSGVVRTPSVAIEANPATQESLLSSYGQQQQFSYKPRMLTSDGYEYIGNEMIYNISDIIGKAPLRSVEGYHPVIDQEDIHNRLLKVIGADTRTLITNTTKAPFSFIGAMGYSPDIYVCTGTVIYQSAVLSAAHCVYDRKTQQWMHHAYFAPGRGNNGINQNDPFGRWQVDTITIFDTYKQATSASSVGLDVSVIKYKPNSNNKSIGDVVGYAGLAEVSGYDDPNLDESTITGYPGDKGGYTMWTMGLCPSGFVSGAEYGFDARVALHDCDITGGTSGSSVMKICCLSANETYKARGVNIFELRSPFAPWNGANIFFQGNGLYDSILYLSGRSSTPVSEPQPYPLPPASCFSGYNTVEVQGVGKISISSLKIGDYVKTKDDAFTQVYSLGHWNHNTVISFLQIFMNQEIIPLEISAKHYVLVQRQQYSTFHDEMFIKASDVIVGDILSGKQVTSIQHVTRRGIYAPLTETGDILVNDILASNYVQLIDSSWMLWNQHTIGHIIWYPQRCFCRYFVDICKHEPHTTEGYTWYASGVIGLGSMINEVGWLASLVLSLMFVPIATIVIFIESTPIIAFYVIFGFGMIAVRRIVTKRTRIS